MELADLSALTLLFTLLMYIWLDGADLGVGMLFFWFRDEQQKQRMVHSILPVWDANETWLVLLAGGMLALFPAAYSKLFSVLYLPVFVMLLCLFIRALALEYRAQAGAVCGAGWINYCLLPPPARLFVRAGARALCLKARACWDSASMPCCVA